MRVLTNIIILFCILPALWSCGSGREEPQEANAGKLSHARLLTLDERDGYTVARVVNPWDTAATPATYILVADSMEMPGQLPKGTVVRTPLKRALVMTAVHSGLIQELGAMDAISAVCSAEYINSPEIHSRIEDGTIIDCGNDASPDMEKIISANPDAILISPYENNPSNPRLESLGSPQIICADYMEIDPLGRAEWMKFFGLLFGRKTEADSMFAATEKEYTAVKTAVVQSEARPSVIFDGAYGAQWYVPRHDTTIASFIRDAGGANPFDSHPGTGSIAMSPEKVLVDAGDADYWLVRYASASDRTLPDFLKDNPVYKEFKAAKEGKVYGCNTLHSQYFEEIPFHPQWFLEQLAALIHPELNLTPSHTYFRPL